MRQAARRKRNRRWQHNLITNGKHMLARIFAKPLVATKTA